MGFLKKINRLRQWVILFTISVVLLATFQNFTRESLVTVSGKLSVEVSDDFKNKKSTTRNILIEKDSGKRYNLSSFSKKNLKTGTQIQVSGSLTAGNNLTSSDIKVLGTAKESVSYSRRMLIYKINLSNKAVNCNYDLANALFSGPNSLNAAYRELSFGTISFSGDVMPTITIPALAPTDGNCYNDYLNWMTLGDEAARASGYDPNSYDHKVYIFPFSAMGCAIGGMAELGGNWEVIDDTACRDTSLGTFTHETGHNLGMFHAATPTEPYGDWSDFMGWGVNLTPISLLNGPHKLQLGLTTVVDALPASEYTLSPIENVGSQIIRVPAGDKYLYVSFRSPAGFDVGLPSQFTQGVSIHSYPGGPDSTILMGTLTTGQTYSDPSGTLITQLGQTATGVRVRVDYSSSSLGCIQSKASLSSSLSSLSLPIGSKFDITAIITNNDTTNCSPRNFNLFSNEALVSSTVFGFNSTVSPNSITLSPGQSAQLKISLDLAYVTKTGSAAFNVYSVNTSGELQSDWLKIPLTITSKISCQIYDYGLAGTVTQASSVGLSRSIVSSESGLNIFVEGKNNGQPISSTPIPLSATPALSSSGSPPMYFQTWAPCGTSGCPSGNYERTYHLRDSSGITKCIVGPAYLSVQ